MTEKAPSRTAKTPRLYDELLVTLAQSGDRAAADRLARRWHPRLLLAARRYANDPGTAEQLTQDCWVAIWRGLNRLRDPSKFAPWAFTILRMKGADTIREQVLARTRQGEEEDIIQAATQENSTLIGHAFAALPADQRLAAHLHFVEGLTLREIAEVQGVAIGTAKSRLFHARRKLKSALGEDTKLTSQGEQA